MRAALLCLLAPALTGCAALSVPPVSEPVEGDSFQFCPVRDEVRARNFLGMGDRLTWTEDEMRATLRGLGIYFEQEETVIHEICDENWDSDDHTIYHVYGSYPGRRQIRNRWMDYFILIDDNGFVHQIKSSFVFSTS